MAKQSYHNENEFWFSSMRIGKILAICFCSLIWFIGCGPNLPETANVSGTITFQGKPVPMGRILFWPTKGRPAMAEIQPDGTYELTTFNDSDGAMIGSHRVTIKATRIHFPAGSTTKGVVEWVVPQRYESLDKSPLTAEVSAGNNSIDFDLSN